MLDCLSRKDADTKIEPRTENREPPEPLFHASVCGATRMDILYKNRSLTPNLQPLTPTLQPPPPSPYPLTPGLAACPIQVLPPLALLEHGLQVLLPDHAVLHGIFDDRTEQAGGHVASTQPAIAEVRRKRQAAVDYR